VSVDVKKFSLRLSVLSSIIWNVSNLRTFVHRPDELYLGCQFLQSIW